MCGGGSKKTFCPAGKWTLVVTGSFWNISRTYRVTMNPETRAQAKQTGVGPPWYWTWSFTTTTDFKFYPWDLYKRFYIKPAVDSTANVSW